MWLFLILIFIPQFTSADSCPPNYTPCSVSKCFLAVEQNKTWTKAQRHCTETGGSLAVISSITQNHCINAMTAGQTHNYWIGMVQIGDSGWIWVDGSEVVYKKWNEGDEDKEYSFAIFSPHTATWQAKKSGVIFSHYFLCSATPIFELLKK